MSLFEHIAADDDRQRTIQRTATAVANKRVKDRFEAFFANASDADRAARLALVEDDIKTDVQSVVDEYGGDAEKITSAIMQSLSGAEHLKEFQFKKKDAPDAGDEEAEVEAEEAEEEAEAENPKSATTKVACDHEYDGDNEECKHCGTKKESSVHTARRPKMCPYHSEVTDISLGTGDPHAGYNSMSSQAWGDKHCKGGYDGSCNFKPAMVTKQYWDDKKAEYAERAQQRELDNQKIVEPIVPQIDTEPIMTAEPLPSEQGEGVTDINSELAEAPSAVGDMVFAHTAAGPVFQPGDRVFSHYVMDWGTVEDVGQTTPEATHGVTGSPLPSTTWYDVRMDKTGQTEMLDDGGGNWDMARIVPPEIARSYGYGDDPQAQGGQGGPHMAADAPKGAGGAVERVSLPSADESGLGGPSPKIDKGTWTGLDPIDTETSGTPHPTVKQELVDGAHWERLPETYPFDGKFLDQTDSVTKQQDLPANSGDAGFSDSAKPSPTSDPYTWTEDNGTNPVTQTALSSRLGSILTHRILSMPSAMTAQDFVMLADAIATAPGDQAALANHFAEYLARTNPNFDRERFIAAATQGGQGRDTFRPPEGTDPQLGMQASFNPLRDLIANDYNGFLPASEVDQAISNFDS